jgi:UDP-glucose 4-epimerase
MSTVLLTGGAGYVGSHTSLVLLEAGFQVIVLDNLANSSSKSLERIESLTRGVIHFFEGDVTDQRILNKLFSNYAIDSVFHFAGLKAIGESVKNPLDYYRANVVGAIALLEAMAKANVRNLIFSSSAAVFGRPSVVPVTEDMDDYSPANPYAWSKLMIEKILKDLAASDPRWSIAILRYFNPIGAHESGDIGENPVGIPNNLLPYILQVAAGKLKELQIFGNDYDTRDGTGIRDYIHVMDLAEGHLAALRGLEGKSGSAVWNLGTGRGYSVLEILKEFENITNRKIPHLVTQRRVGDVDCVFADPSKAKRDLNWCAKRNLKSMLTDAWRWQLKNPHGF